MLRVGDNRLERPLFVPVSDLVLCVDRTRNPPTRWSEDRGFVANRISSQLRMQVLQKGKQCMCCKFPLVLRKSMVMAQAIGSSTRRFVTVMEAGHIWAHAAGGPPVLENLFPLCAACNGCMGRAVDGFEWILKTVESYDDYELLPYFMEDYDKWKIWRASYKKPTASLGDGRFVWDAD